MNLKELYQEIILDHGKNPRNLRKSENFIWSEIVLLSNILELYIIEKPF